MRLFSAEFRRLTTAGLLLLGLVAAGCGTQNLASRSTLFGLRIGMDSASALQVLNQPADKLASLPYITGRKILHDTVSLTDCDLAFRRSFAFDSTGHLAVIGMTHKTPNIQLKRDRDCGMKWLASTYGEPAEEFLRDSVMVTAWNVGGAKLTLEAKSYDDNFGFVMIYLYTEGPSFTSVIR